MQAVNQDWEDTNRDYFTRQPNVIISIDPSEEQIMPLISGTNIISFSHEKSGDILSGVLTQDKVVAVVTNPNNKFHFDDEADGSIYKNARMVITEGFMNANYQSYYGISGGVYYISDIARDVRSDQYTLSASTIIAFMSEKYVPTKTGSQAASDLLGRVITQANQSKYVPGDTIYTDYDESLDEIYMDYESSDSYSLAEVLQLIANACMCVLYVNRSGTICLKKLKTTCEHYVLSRHVLYSPLSTVYAEPVLNVELVTNHGNTTTQTTVEGDGAIQVMQNPLLADGNVEIAMADEMRSMLSQSRKQFTGECRFDPAVDLFDLIIVPNGKNVDAACITGISASFNGAWRGTIKAVSFRGVSYNLRICDLETLTIEQIESLTINQLTGS